MNGTRLGFLGLILLFGATFLVPLHITDIAQAAPAWMGDLTVVQMLDSPNDYRWMGTWNPAYDYDWQRHYRVTQVRDCDRCSVRDHDVCATCDRNYDSCDRCAARYYDRSSARDCDLCAARYDTRCDRCGVRDYDRCTTCAVRDCDRCPYPSYYRCDLFGCGWVR